MPLSKAQRDYLNGTINEMMGDALAVSGWARISEDEWSERFGELPHPDDDNLYQPLEDTKSYRAILSERDPRLVWSVIEDPEGDEDAYLYVPGYWPRAEGWHLTTIPWDPNDRVIGAFRRGDPEPP